MRTAIVRPHATHMAPVVLMADATVIHPITEITASTFNVQSVVRAVFATIPRAIVIALSFITAIVAILFATRLPRVDLTENAEMAEIAIAKVAISDLSVTSIVPLTRASMVIATVLSLDVFVT